MSNPGSLELAIPDVLQPAPGLVLPPLSYETIENLTVAGWSRVGILAPLITRAGKLLVLKSHQTDKAAEGMHGPLGETSKGMYPDIEQPIETLERGLREELGVKQPSHLSLRIRKEGGWFTYGWPVGVQHPGEYACAICPALYVPEITEQALLTRPVSNEEIKGVEVMTPEAIMDLSDDTLRPGFRGFLSRLHETGLMRWPAEAEAEILNFSTVYSAMQEDLDLQVGA